MNIVYISRIKRCSGFRLFCNGFHIGFHRFSRLSCVSVYKAFMSICVEHSCSITVWARAVAGLAVRAVAALPEWGGLGCRRMGRVGRHHSWATDEDNKLRHMQHASTNATRHQRSHVCLKRVCVCVCVFVFVFVCVCVSVAFHAVLTMQHVIQGTGKSEKKAPALWGRQQQSHRQHVQAAHVWLRKAIAQPRPPNFNVGTHWSHSSQQHWIDGERGFHILM